MSFYYWKTTFNPDSAETRVLQENQVKRLYVRYFDVDLPPTDSFPGPVAPLRSDSTLHHWQVVPVIYFRNRVFQRIDPAGIRLLVQHVYELTGKMNDSFRVHPGEIQFDCDWTEGTREPYFSFIRQYRALSGQPVSATIRLHQVKFAARTGVPPIDHGILMYYNMGNIDGSDQRSIYERSTAGRYIPYLRSYPLPLDIALPVFIWGLHVRDGKVIELLNKMNFEHFENDSNFTASKSNWFTTRHSCFSGGYYFRQGDAVKIEHVSEDELKEMVEDINRYSNHRIRDLIFYDLDKVNLTEYDKSIFQKIVDLTD